MYQKIEEKKYPPICVFWHSMAGSAVVFVSVLFLCHLGMVTVGAFLFVGTTVVLYSVVFQKKVMDWLEEICAPKDDDI